ncbi:MAG: carboxypeptidase-like regulatory domain-containing protein [Planctomycetota bacterium]
MTAADPTTTRRLVALLAGLAIVLAATAVGLGWGDRAEPHGAARSDRGPRHTGPAASPQTNGLAADRNPIASTTKKPSGPAPFRSQTEDGEVIANPSRDGLVIVLVDARGGLVGHHAMTVAWRKGWGEYGSDSGLTDPAGRFATTVASADMLEGVTTLDPATGDELATWQTFDPPPAGRHGVTVQLPDKRRFAARVVDFAADPIADAQVSIAAAPTRPMQPGVHTLGRAEFQLTTDREGWVEASLPVGFHEMRVTRDGYRATAQWEVEIVPERERTVGVLRMSGGDHRRGVSVRVTRPTEGARVSAWTNRLAAVDRHVETPGVRRTPEQRSWGARPTQDGHFQLRVDPLPVHVTVQAEGYEPRDVEVATTTDAIEVALQPTGPRPYEKPAAMLQGVVRDPDGAPVSGAKVGWLRDQRIAYATFAHTDRDGRFTFPLGSTKPLFLTVRARPFAFLTVGPLTPTPDRPALELVLEPEQEVRGVVVDEHGAGVAADIRMYRERGALGALTPQSSDPFLNGGDAADHTRSSEDGTFRLRGVGAGRCEVWASDHRALAGRAEARPGAPVRVVLGRGLEGRVVLRGHVRDAVTAHGIADATVRCVPGRAGQGRGYFSVVSGADGAYTNGGATPGRLVVQVRARGYALLELPATTYPAGPTRLDVELQPARRLAVQVVDGGGNPIRGIRISAYDAAGRRIEFQDQYGHEDGSLASTDRAGRVDLAGLPRGLVRFVVGVQTDSARANWLDPPSQDGPPVEFTVDLTEPRRDLLRWTISR